MKNKTNVLVIGAPRSGTTLLAGLLSAGQEASPMLPECTYITQIIQHFHDFLHYADSQRFAAYAIDEPILAGMYRAMVDSMLATVQSHFKEIDYRYLILKDPELTQLIDLIPCFFGEDSKTVCVVRDPRAVIASMLEVERKKNVEIHFTKLISDFFMYYWRVQESLLYKCGRVHLVRYEKIVAREEDEFKKMEAYLGFAVGREGFGKVHFDFDRADPTYSGGYGGAIQAASTDFREKLTPSQINEIEVVFSGTNVIYGWWK